ncbi:MAG: hypothetical protein ACOYNS_14515 [Bacteroidota bacterium]
MKKRLWLLIGILTAGIAQLLLNSMWKRTFPVMDILLLYKAVSAFSYAAVIGLLYLHVPEPGRRLRAGLILGSIIGLLIGSYQYFDSLAFSVSSLPMNVFEIARLVLLGAVCGTAVAVSELRWNPNRKKMNGTTP